MPVWELRSDAALRLQRRTAKMVRTYGAYEVFIDGEAVPNLSGHVCERTGPGDNTANGKKNHLRIREGRYALSTQFTSELPFGRLHRYSETSDAGISAARDTSPHRHPCTPGHPPKLFLSSIGCFNPTKPLRADQDMDFTESRGRVIALIDSLKLHDPAAFALNKIGHNTAIQSAFMVVDGEPMGPVSDDAIV